MFDKFFRKELDWGGKTLTLETGKIARQADGAVMARYGDSIVLCTAVGVRSTKPGQDFFPLTVNYQEKAFAAGKIPGGFFKREGKPHRKGSADLSRLIDRPHPPVVPRGLLQRGRRWSATAAVATTCRTIPTSSPWSAASAALTISGVPVHGAHRRRARRLDRER